MDDPTSIDTTFRACPLLLLGVFSNDFNNEVFT